MDILGSLSTLLTIIKTSRAVAAMSEPEFISAFRTFVYRYLVWWMYGLAIIEVVAIILKGFGVKVPLVSQVAKETVFGAPTFNHQTLVALAYFFVGMGVHWFVTWGRLPLDGSRWEHPLGVFFWLVGLAYFLADKFDPNWTHWPTWALFVRHPSMAGLLGGLLAFFCFPQKSVWALPKPW